MRPKTLPSTCPTFHDSVHHHLSVTSHQRPAFPRKRVWGKASSVANRWARAVTVFSIYGCLCGDRLWLMPEVSLGGMLCQSCPVPQQLCPLQHSRYGVCIAVVGTGLPERSRLPTDLFEAD